MHELVGIDPRLGIVHFDAVMVGSDPLTIVAVEHKSPLTATTLDETVRKARTFVWSAYSNNKVALLNLILLLPEMLSAEQMYRFEKQLSGVARVFTVAETMS